MVRIYCDSSFAGFWLIDHSLICHLEGCSAPHGEGGSGWVLRKRARIASLEAGILPGIIARDLCGNRTLKQPLSGTDAPLEADRDGCAGSSASSLLARQGPAAGHAAPQYDLRGRELIIASHNRGKAAEIQRLLTGLDVRVLTADDVAFAEPEETEPDFVGNALLKARVASLALGKTVIADDSGLVVPALGGAPGIYSARWAGPDKDFSLAMARVEAQLRACGSWGAPESVSRRIEAHFVCALALCWPDGYCRSFEGIVHGRLTFPPRGSLGFGYDPIFIPDGFEETFAEMEPDAKHKMSHRARAFDALMQEFA